MWSASNHAVEGGFNRGSCEIETRGAGAPRECCGDYAAPFHTQQRQLINTNYQPGLEILNRNQMSFDILKGILFFKLISNPATSNAVKIRKSRITATSVHFDDHLRTG